MSFPCSPAVFFKLNTRGQSLPINVVSQALQMIYRIVTSNLLANIPNQIKPARSYLFSKKISFNLLSKKESIVWGYMNYIPVQTVMTPMNFDKVDIVVTNVSVSSTYMIMTRAPNVIAENHCPLLSFCAPSAMWSSLWIPALCWS